MSIPSGPPTKTAIRFGLMGRIQLTFDGQAVAIGSRARTLLATLVMAGGVLSKEKAATSMWPESPTTQCLSNLRNLLYVLRKERPELAGVLQVEGEQLRLGELEVDIWMLQHLLSTPDVPTAEVLSAYPGHLASELEGSAASALRQSLASEFFGWAGERISLLEVSRQYEEALRVAEHVLRVEPSHEPTYRAVMRLHAYLGDVALALRAYEACREALDEEVGEAPSRETRALARRIREQMEVAPPLRNTNTPEMIGREVEWRQLTGAWRACLGGTAALHAIEGPAGIGKTRLMEEFVGYLTRQGHRALLVQCLELQTHTPFAVLMSVMNRLENASQAGAARRESTTKGLQEALRSPPQLLQLQLQQQATTLVRRELPCCVIIDDAQWCDSESLAWLQEATVTLAPEPILWIFSHLPLMPRAPLRRLLSTAARRGRFIPMQLAALSVEESVLLARQSGSKRADSLISLAEGNPLALTQLVSHQWQNDQLLPLTLTAAFERQLAQSGEAQMLAAIMAIAERPLSLRFLDALELPEMEAHLEALLALRLAEECTGGTVRLVHGLLKKHLLDKLQRLTFRRLNGMIGKAWMRLSAPEAPPEQIAESLEAGGLEAEAAQYFLLAVGPLVLRGRLDLAYGYASRAEALATSTGRESLAWQAATQMANIALAACDEVRLIRALARLEDHISAATEGDAAFRIEAFRVELWFMQGELNRVADGYLQLLDRVSALQERSLAFKLVAHLVRFFLRMRGFLPDRSHTVADQQLLQSLAVVRQVHPPESAPELWSNLAQIIWSEDLVGRNPLLLQSIRDIVGTEALVHTGSSSKARDLGFTVVHPEETEENLAPFETAKRILTRLSGLSDVRDRIMGLDYETLRAYRLRRYSLVLFLCIASKHILEQKQWHAVGTFSQEIEVATCSAILHPRRGLVLADGFAARQFSSGCAVVEAFLNIHRCWMLVSLDEWAAFKNVLERLILLESTIGPHHPHIRLQIEKLTHEALVLQGDAESALAASERFYRSILENSNPGEAAWQGIQGHVLRLRAGLPSVGGTQLEAWTEVALRYQSRSSNHICWLYAMISRAFSEEGLQEKADLYQQRASAAFDQALMQLSPSHRHIFAFARAPVLGGRTPLPAEYSTAHVTTLTDEEQWVADNALRWISGG